jgi:hypothetical protein
MDRDGLLKVADLEEAITDETAVVSVPSKTNRSHAEPQSRPIAWVIVTGGHV